MDADEHVNVAPLVVTLRSLLKIINFYGRATARGVPPFFRDFSVDPLVYLSKFAMILVL